MEDSDPPPQAPLADMDVNMGEADALPPGFVRRNPNVINLIDDDGNESDSTLLDNEIGPRVVPQISEARRKRRHVRTRAATFEDLQTYRPTPETVIPMRSAG